MSRRKDGMDEGIARVIGAGGFDALFYGHPDATYAYDLSGGFVDCNDALCALTGYGRDELRAMAFEALIDPRDRDLAYEKFAEATRGATVHFRAACVAKDGDPLVVDVTMIPLRESDGQVVGVMGIARDVSALRRLADEVEESHSINRIAGRIARFAGWSVDAATGRLRWSDELYEILGYQRGEAPEHADLAGRILDEPQRREFEVLLSRCVTEGLGFSTKVAMRDARGEPLVVRLIGEAARDDTGRVVRVDGAFHDVTSIERQRADLEELEGRVARTLNELDTPLAFVDRDWRITFANEAATRLTGRSVDELTTGTIWDVFPEAINSGFASLYRRAMDEGEVGTEVAFAEGFGRSYEATVYPTSEGIVITARDVTAQVETNRTIVEYTNRVTFLAQMLDLAKDAMIVRDFEQGIIYWNRSAEEIYGWTFEEVRGRNGRDLFYLNPSDSDVVFDSIMENGFWMGEVEHKTKDGRRIWVDCRRQLIRDGEGRPIGIFGVNTDVTASRREKESRVRAQRMESLGTLAGGIAHDLNNVLAPILMSIDLLVRDEQDERRLQLLSSMQASVRRGADMIRQVLSFARGVEGEREALDLRGLLGEVQQFCRDTLPRSIEFDFDVDDDLGVVVGDATQLMQVLVNLVTNARDAMPEGGRLSVRAYNALSEDLASAPTRTVVVQVADSGVGMENAVVARVFEPFFTTKEFGAGTGLGLSTSTAIVKSHGGRIEVVSEPGRGTRFDVVLAAVDAPPRSLEAVVESRSRAGLEGVRVLVVDDEEPIRLMLDQVLTAEGLEVETAANGHEALEVLKAAIRPYDLVITDLNMPQIGGDRLAALAGELGVPTRFLFMSGVGAARAGLDEAGLHLDKPFTTVELLARVRRAVGR
ncbi:MAG TPA: PAS domain S-box protein [Acidimicrobiales bacterium]|nr:PAS domain S-box protein [Acidimicrobiales bacterium]